MARGKEYQFVVSLKRPNTKLIDFISVLLSVISLFIFTYFLLTTYNWQLYALSLLLQVFFLTKTFIRSRSSPYIHFRAVFLVAFVTWIVGPNSSMLLAAFYLVAALIETQIKFPEEIGVDEDGLTFNTLFNKHIAWADIQNMVLKDDIITIDQKNNKLFQKETDNAVADDTVKEFNDFCSMHINKAR